MIGPPGQFGSSLPQGSLHCHLNECRGMSASCPRYTENARTRYAARPPKQRNVDGCFTSSLLDAAKGGRLLDVRRAVEEQGVAVNSASTNGVAALIAAAGSGHRVVVQYLAGVCIY